MLRIRLFEVCLFFMVLVWVMSDSSLSTRPFSFLHFLACHYLCLLSLWVPCTFLYIVYILFVIKKLNNYYHYPGIYFYFSIHIPIQLTKHIHSQ